MQRIFILAISLLFQVSTHTADLFDISDEELQRKTGMNAAEIVNHIRDNDNDPNPAYLKYISAPDLMPDILAQQNSEHTVQRFPYAPLVKAGIVSSEQAQEMAYDFAYNDLYRVYHAQPVVNEIIQRLQNTQLTQYTHGAKTNHQQSAELMPLMYFAVTGGSPVIIDHLIARGIAVNPKLGNSATPTDLASKLLLNRIKKASDEEFTVRYDVLKTLLQNSGHTKEVTPSTVTAQKQNTPQQTYTDHRYRAIASLLSIYQA